jgi:hypothetical protein
MRPETSRSREGLDLFKLETPQLTFAFWGAVGLFTLAFFVTPYLPLIDYHQHVAIAALMRRLFDPAAPEHALYEVNLVTYNGGFHLLVALLSYVLPPIHAGRVVMAAYPILFALAALSIVREAERPRWYAFLALPITYSRGMAWGFANWNLTFPVAMLGITWFMRYSRGDRKALLPLLLASCFCAYGHVLAMLCLCAGMGVVQLSRLYDLGPTWSARLAKLVSTPLAVAPGVLWCVFVYRYQTKSSFSNWTEASYDGTDDPLWFKLRHLLDMSVGSFWDLSDNVLLALALGICFLLTKLGSPEPRSSDSSIVLDVRAVRWLTLFFFGCYLVIPKVFVATWFVYERFTPLAMLFLCGALPLRLMPNRDEIRAAAAGIGVAAGANTARVWATMGDVKDAMTIIDAVPEGKRLLAITYNATTERISRDVFVHLPAVYQQKKRGEIAYTFTKFESMPVHYKPGKAPPTVNPGFEWDGRHYDVHSEWARAYDVTMVVAADDGDPASMAFREESYRVKLMARAGRFWLYDTSALARPLRWEE